MRAFEEILDKMAYLYFEEPEDDEPVEGDFAFIGEIVFSGVISGSLNVFFTRNSAEEIARNLVGIRECDELFDGTMADAVSEFTNMVMGRTMTTLDFQHRFEMDVPKIVDQPSPPPENTTTLEIVGNLEEEPCRLLIHYREGRG